MNIFHKKQYWFNLAFLILLQLLFIDSVLARGNMVARCEKLETQHLGIDDAGFAVANDSYNIETGKCYKLEISSSGRHEYILLGAEFFSSIYIRKLEVGKVELGINSLHSIDFDDAVSVELYFLVLKPDRYKIFDKYLGDKGTQFEFIVE